ncbi:KxYKxGKxW signal peptide domain-containing protein [Weissella cibaria]
MEMNRTHKKLYKAGKLWVSATLLMGAVALTPTPIAKAAAVAQTNAKIVKTNVTNAKKYAASAKQEATKATAAKNAANSAATNANKAYTAETKSYNIIASAKKSAGKYVGKATVANIKAAKTLATTATNANKIVASNYKTIVTANTTATSQAKKATVAAKNAATYATKAATAAKSATSAAKKAKSKTSTNLAKSATTSVNAAKTSATSANKANSAASKAATTVKATTSKATLVSKNASAAVKYIQSVAAQPISSAAAPSTAASDGDDDQARMEAENKAYREQQISDLKKAGATAAQINTYTSRYEVWTMTHNRYMYSGNIVTGLDGQHWLMVYKMSTYYFIDPNGNDLGANPYTATGLQIKTYSDKFAGNKARMIIDTAGNYYLMVTLKDNTNRYINGRGDIVSITPTTTDDLNVVSDVTAKASAKADEYTIYSQLKNVQMVNVTDGATGQKHLGYMKLTFNNGAEFGEGENARFMFDLQGYSWHELDVFVSPTGEVSTNQQFTADNSAKPTDKQQNIIDAFNRLNGTNLQATK